MTFRLASTHRDRLAAFRLAYEQYLESGMVHPNLYGLRLTEFHLLDSTAVFVAERNHRVIGTATLIVDGELGLPLDAVHPGVTAEARGRGMRVGEVSSLAIRSPGRPPEIPVFFGLTRLMAQYARASGVGEILVSCVPEHARFYCRCLGFEQLGRTQPYASVCNTLGVACRLDFAEINASRPDFYERYFSDLIPSAQLVNSRMSEAERRFFADVVDHSQHRPRRSA